MIGYKNTRSRMLSCLLALAVTCCMLLSFIGCDTTYVGVKSAEINDKGELVLTYEDGKEQNLGVVVGKDGQDGQDGQDGKDGLDGKDGQDGKDGADGKDGLDGKDGANGKNGIDGKDGKDGKDGADGKDAQNNIINNYDVDVSGSADNIALATAKGLLSSVSINALHTDASGEEYGSAGSGVIYYIDKEKGDALIITNYHVLYDRDSNTVDGISDNVKVFLYGSEYADYAIDAKYVGGSINYDIALIRIEGSDILKNSYAEAVSFESSDNISLGQTAIAIGNAKGYGISATYGVISVESEHIEMSALDDSTKKNSLRIMRIDTAVNKGNSGGGLFDGEGNLIGIVNAKIIDSSVENIAYALPSSMVQGVVENIIKNCNGQNKRNMQRAMLGVTVQITDSFAEYNDKGQLKIREEITVAEVSQGSIAEGILQAGDILVSASLGDRVVNVTRQHNIIELLHYAVVGDTVYVTVMRDGAEITLPMVITASSIIDY